MKELPNTSPIMQLQRGGALMVALVLIFMLSVMGMSAMRESTLEKRMATNSVHKASTLQAAESATEITLNDPDNLSAAFTSASTGGTGANVPLPPNINTELQTSARIFFAGSGPPIGFSLGSGAGFQALRFVVRGNASIDAVQSNSQVAQGANRTVPSLQQ